MTRTELNGILNYYFSLEEDLSNTSRYIEPSGQENVHSFEFAKLLILSCTEVESIFKLVCFEIEGQQVEGTIAKYKEVILKKYPQITEAIVTVSRLGKTIVPFAAWKNGKLPWWDAYQQVKHNRGIFFEQATYLNAVTAMSALYILILYLSEITGFGSPVASSGYIHSEYGSVALYTSPQRKLPDFEVTS